MSRWCGQGIFHHPIRWSGGFGVWRWGVVGCFFGGMCLPPVKREIGSPQKKTCVLNVLKILFQRKFQSCVSSKLQVTECLQLFILFCWFPYVFVSQPSQWFSVHREPSSFSIGWASCNLNILSFQDVLHALFHLYKPMVQSSIPDCTLIPTDHTNCGSMVWLQWASWRSPGCSRIWLDLNMLGVSPSRNHITIFIYCPSEVGLHLPQTRAHLCKTNISAWSNWNLATGGSQKKVASLKQGDYFGTSAKRIGVLFFVGK